MAPSSVSPQKETEYDHSWQMLIEITLPSESAGSSLAADLVTGTVETLNWPAENLEQLKQALIQATQNTVDRHLLNCPESFLIIRVLIPEESETLPETALVAARPVQSPLSHRTDKRANPLLSRRGRGFFLVQKQGDIPPVLTQGPHQLIELFLYHEGKQSPK